MDHIRTTSTDLDCMPWLCCAQLRRPISHTQMHSLCNLRNKWIEKFYSMMERISTEHGVDRKLLHLIRRQQTSIFEHVKHTFFLKPKMESNEEPNHERDWRRREIHLRRRVLRYHKVDSVSLQVMHWFRTSGAHKYAIACPVKREPKKIVTAAAEHIFSYSAWGYVKGRAVEFSNEVVTNKGYEVISNDIQVNSRNDSYNFSLALISSLSCPNKWQMTLLRSANWIFTWMSSVHRAVDPSTILKEIDIHLFSIDSMCADSVFSYSMMNNSIDATGTNRKKHYEVGVMAVWFEFGREYTCDWHSRIAKSRPSSAARVTSFAR